MKTHELKTTPGFFQAIASGDKTFELHKDDRDFQVGDKLWLREFSLWPVLPLIRFPRITVRDGRYTGDEIHCVVTYKLVHFPGLEDGYCILGIRLEEDND